MQNFVKEGNVVTLTSPGGGVVSGTPVLIGSIVCVPTATVAATFPFEGQVTGVVSLAKATGAWTEGALLYWDNSAKNVTTTSTSNYRIGCAAKAAASGDATGLVRLNGVAVPTGA